MKLRFFNTLKALGLWAIAYVLLRALLVPWRLVAKPSLIEVATSGAILLAYAIIWKKLRAKLGWKNVQALKKCWPSFLMLLAWALIYLVGWRARNGHWDLDWQNALLEYYRNDFFGGFVLSEISEEIAYRGVLLLLLIGAGWSPRASVAIQALDFVLPHYLGVALGQMDAMRSLSTFLLGVVFGWGMLQTQRLTVPVAFHIAWNIVSGFIFQYVERV